VRRTIFLDTSYLLTLIGKEDVRHKVVFFDSEGMEKALALYKGRPDKAWGLVDCFSFVVMKEGRLKVALCFDEHFRQALKCRC